MFSGGANIDERGPYVGGDMVIPPEQLMESRAGIVGDRYRWTKGQIPYVLTGAFSKFLKEMGEKIHECYCGWLTAEFFP